MPDLEVFPNAAEAVSPPPVADPTPQVSPAGDGTATQEPFLTIDDRTSYKTREDAVKGWQDTKQRAIELSPWGEFAKRYRFETAEDAEAVLAEYLDLKKQAEAAAAQPAPVAVNEYKQLSNEDIYARAQGGDKKAEREWNRRFVEQNAEEAGYVKKDYVDNKFNEVRQADAATREEARVNAALSDGENILKELLGKEGIEDTEQVEDAYAAIERWILKQSRDKNNNIINGSLEAQFLAGADSRRKVIEQGIARYLKPIGGYVAKKTAATATQKEKAIAAAPKPLPAGNTVQPPAAGKGKARTDLDDPEFLRDVKGMFK